MNEACGKLFGPADEAMINYYAVFEEAMLKTDELVGNWHLPSPEKVYTPVVELKADKWIEIAEKNAASCTNKNIKKRIAQEKALWNNAKSVLAKLRVETKKTYKVIVDGKEMAYNSPTVTREIIISLYGLSDNVKVDIIEKDGQNRRLLNNEKIRLEPGVVFNIIK